MVADDGDPKRAGTGLVVPRSLGEERCLAGHGQFCASFSEPNGRSHDKHTKRENVL